MTPTDHPLRVAVLVQRGLYRATLRHALAEIGVSVVDLGVDLCVDLGVPPQQHARGRPAATVVLVEHAPWWLSVEDALQRVSALLTATAVVLLVEPASPWEVERWLAAGCRGVLWKEAPGSELELAIESVRRGVPYVSAAVCPHLAV